MDKTATVGMLRKQVGMITELLEGLDEDMKAPHDAYIALRMTLRLLQEEKMELTAR